MKNIQVSTSLAILILFLLSTCSKSETEIVQPLYHSTLAKNYLTEVLSIMQNNSINKHRITWSDFRSEVLTAADGAETIEDTYPGIEKALELLDDNHSFYVKPDGSGFSASVFQCGFENITEDTWPENIGYVKINSFSGSANDSDAINFAEEIQQQIRAQDNHQLQGWIVDLRGNLGGNMWPMLAGIGPILGEGIAGYFIDSDNNQGSWGFSNGASTADEIHIITQVPNSYELLNQNPRVAVLLNKSIASSGEALAISFLGREDTKFFGTSTCGLSTSNQQFILSDGAALYLTNSYFADRNKNIPMGPIEPEVMTENEEIIQIATEWIRE